MTLPWNRHREEQAARRKSVVGWLLLSALGTGMVGAAMFWLSKEAQAQQRAEPEREERESMPGRDFEPTVGQIEESPMNGAVPATANSTKRGKHTRSEEAMRLGADGQAPSAESAKMLSGAEELRDREFPIPAKSRSKKTKSVIEDEGMPQPEQVRSGGSPGEIKGDMQRAGEVPTIMDQDMVTPDFAQEE